MFLSLPPSLAPIPAAFLFLNQFKKLIKKQIKIKILGGIYKVLKHKNRENLFNS